MPWPTIVYTLIFDEVMVVTGLVGALVASSYKWGYFVFATIALFFIAFNVTHVGRLRKLAYLLNCDYANHSIPKMLVHLAQTSAEPT
jgi:bacteriorhodopsin